MQSNFSLYNNFFNSIEDILTVGEFIKKGNAEYLNLSCVFDIETSSFYDNSEKRACMYAWVFGINGKCIKGRTWEEFLYVINKVSYFYNTNTNKRVIIYVHNLAYEFQWFKKLFNWSKVFSLENRRPIYSITDFGIEFRCSYLLSGLSLYKVGENLLKYKVAKMIGDLDYELIRSSNTKLTDKEWTYILNDGLVVMAYIQEELEREGNITKLPYTKTGYVRKLCRNKCFEGNNKYNYSKMIKSLTMNIDDYNQFKRVFTGGFTHANHNYVDKIINDVSSFDFTSSYPTVMVSERFPMSKPRNVKITKDNLLFYLNNYACMFDIRFYKLESKVDYEHYISKSRCSLCENFLLDNGRIIRADILQISITEVDFNIITKMYTWEHFEINNFKIMDKGYLPKELIETVLKLYSDKTTLKGVEEKQEEYMVSKGMINGCYGMCVTDPCKDEIEYNNDIGWNTAKSDIENLINKYNNSGERFLYYAWGIWITAYSRYNLFTGINEFKNDYIYSDTDSIKVINKDNHIDYFKKYNEKIILKINQCLAYYNLDLTLAKPKTIKNVEKPLGIWDYEGTYTRFKTLGAKRYMYELDNKIHITISGVNKKNGIEFLQYKFKNNTNIFKNFKNNLEFPAKYNDNGIIKNGSGKLCHTYIDNYIEGITTDYLGNEFNYSEQSSVHMEPTSYNLSLEENFLKYISLLSGSIYC